MQHLEVRTLLIIDDDPGVLETLGEMLKPIGVEILQASGPTEAMAILSQRPVTAILSDIRMPGLTGLEFVENLRAQNINTPVVYLTASPSKENILRALQLGAVDFIEKPCPPKALENIITKALEIGVQQHEIECLQNSLEEQNSGEKNTAPATTSLHKKNRLINLLRINLPFHK